MSTGLHQFGFRATRPRATPHCAPFLLALGLFFLFLTPAGAESVEDEVGRSEIRIYGAPFSLEPGLNLTEARIPQRLERLGYRRVHRKPQRAGEFFWGHDRFWIFRRSHTFEGETLPAESLMLDLDRKNGRIVAVASAQDGDDEVEALHLEPEILAESFTERRAPRRPVDFEALPEVVWKAILAAEDARFFDHGGVDARGVARAALANARAGKVVQGGSTITQQLIKIRDLSPRRTLGRKVNEALRALELEARWSKEEILASYLDHVYLGHVDGISLYGYGAASRTYFGLPPERLDLSRSAALAAMIQGPNRLSPVRHRERLETRWSWVLGRLEELGWATPEAVAAARSRGLPKTRLQSPREPGARHFRSLLRQQISEDFERRLTKGKGFVIESSLDPLMQELAEESIARGLRDLRRRHRSLRGRPLSTAAVVLDARSGAILAYIGGDPAADDAFDRARQARRQPGSAIKPLLLLEAFEGCGRRASLYPARRVDDAPLTLELPSGLWSPVNDDDEYRGVVTLREAFVQSLNVPFVRVAQWCGLRRTASAVEDAGLDLPRDPPPAFALGAVETRPLDLASAFTLFTGDLGRRVEPRPWSRVSTPEGRRLQELEPDPERVVRPATAWLIRDLMTDAVERGTGRRAAPEDLPSGHRDLAPWGKTGTSSDQRDAWFVGGVGPLVAAVWVGLDDGSPLGLSGGRAAAPLWRELMESLAPLRPPQEPQRPREILELSVQRDTGLAVRKPGDKTMEDLFRRGATPPKRRWWKRDEALEVVR
ncbi:MAG: transglycosylase domain-containing protein [Acidobacteriota bacterium]